MNTEIILTVAVVLLAIAQTTQAALYLQSAINAHRQRKVDIEQYSQRVAEDNKLRAQQHAMYNKIVTFMEAHEHDEHD